MAKHHEKVTLSETPAPAGWVERQHFPRGLHHRVVEGKAAPFLHFAHKPKTIPLGGGVPSAHGRAKKTEKSKSLDGRSEKDDLSIDPLGGLNLGTEKKVVAGNQPLQRARSMEKVAASKLKNIGLAHMRKSASYSQFVDTQLETPYLEADVPEKWKCDMSQLFLGQKFACGNRSRIYHGEYKGQTVAVKILKLDDCKEAAKFERQFMQEVYCLSQLHHPNIVQFVAASRVPNACCIIMEYAPHGSVRAFLHKSEPRSIPLKTIATMALDVARGMEYLHSQGVVHRDLKSENLVLTEDLHVKLTDFGVGCLESQCDLLKADTGTYRWMAPEMINHKHTSKKVDVYSFGIVLWELVTGLVPFEEMTPVQAAYAVVHKNARPVIPVHCPGVLQRLMQQCWTAHPEKRPAFHQIVKCLEEFETSLNNPDVKFNSTWHPPHEHHHMFLSCFTGISAENQWAQEQASGGIRKRGPGNVYLVGTGPGDPDLLTVKALEFMQTAELVLYDRLVSADILELVHSGARLIYVGKPSGYIVEHRKRFRAAAELCRVWCNCVEIKGRRPIGITAASGIAAKLGIPFTHRGAANSVRFLIGHSKKGGEDPLYVAEQAADPDSTLVVYMGLATLPAPAAKLVAKGLPS